MNRFSRIRHHVNMEDVKEKHSQTLAAKAIEEEHKKRLQEVFKKQKPSRPSQLETSCEGFFILGHLLRVARI